MADVIHAMRTAVRAVLLVMALVFMSACDVLAPQAEPVDPETLANPTSTRAPIGAQGVYRLQPGDTVNVFVFDNPDLSQSTTIAPDGRLSYPLAGSIQAKGRTLDEIRRILASRFSNSIVAPQVAVSLTSRETYRIYVNGEVIQPGAFDLNDPVTLVQAITLAGGFTAFADRERIIVYNPTRTSGARRIFDYTLFVETPQAQDIVLHPGDTVIVQ